MTGGGRAKAAGEEALVGVAALLSVPAGIPDGSVQVSLGTLRPTVVCGTGDSFGKETTPDTQACSMGGCQPKLLGLFCNWQSSLDKHFQVTLQKQQTNFSARIRTLMQTKKQNL